MPVAVASIVPLALSLGFLHVTLGVFFWLPEPSVAALAAPSVDWLVLILGACGAAWLGDKLGGGVRGGARFGRRLGRVLSFAITVWIAACAVLGFGQGFARREFGYDVVVALHVRYVPELFRMMYSGESPGMFVLYCGLLAAALVALFVAIRASLHGVARVAVAPRGRLGLAATAVVYLVVLAPFTGVAGSASKELVQQGLVAISLDKQLEESARKLEAENQRIRPDENPFAEMSDPPSIYLFLIESYGAVTFRSPQLRDQAVPFVGEREEELTGSGYAVRSAYLDAPVFGGSSWMAGGSILCGVSIGEQQAFDSLFVSDAVCFPELFNRAGYRTIESSSASTFLEDDYARTYAFDAFYHYEDFEYAGMGYSWSRVPDQYVINFIHEREVLARDEPRFIYHFLTSSHHPWDHVPPYIDDWDIGDGSDHLSGGGRRFRNRFSGGDEYVPGYWATVQYSMRAVVDYAANMIPEDDALIVILGDHQPREPIADMDGPWWVPVHIASRDHDAVRAFSRFGYEEGMIPPDLAPDDPAEQPEGLHHLMRHIFEAYAEGADG